ncbi:MAG: heme peroxidase [Alphaproteobacteria bacterium]|nr:heme peroxidase [Alphaproteobacteria bacterium]MCB9930185.1 heme peroxidase [Alphaproteobacteria bacterium]
MASSSALRWLERRLFDVVEAVPVLAVHANRILINRAVGRARTRPHPWSTAQPYTSWTALSDRSWSGRHLPPKPVADLPPVETLTRLFARPEDRPADPDGKSTCLFPAFAQYLTDGFIRTLTEPLADRIGLSGLSDDELFRRTTSNHQIDLCPLYGRTPAQTAALRQNSETPGERGRLKSQTIDGEEYAPFLYRDGELDPQFAVLDPVLGDGDGLAAEKRATLFAFGGDRANSVPQVAMLNTLFLREHNRLAGEIAQRHPDWDDTRVFETARNVVIVLFIKIVVEEYINHISPKNFSIRADPRAAWRAAWNKPNWITTEFSLLYRWHALIPDAIPWGGGEPVPVARTFLDHGVLLRGGLLAAFRDISATPATRLGLFNTTKRLLHVEERSIRQGRACQLASYSDYRAYVGLDRPQRFEDVTSDPQAAEMLRRAYGSVDRIEFFVGLFAEDRTVNSSLPPLILRFVAIDAFSQALTNPLLSEHVFKPETFSAPGWDAIQNTVSLRDLLARNTPGGIGETFVGMTRPEWDFV